MNQQLAGNSDNDAMAATTRVQMRIALSFGLQFKNSCNTSFDTIFLSPKVIISTPRNSCGAALVKDPVMLPLNGQLSATQLSAHTAVEPNCGASTTPMVSWR